MPSIRNYTSTVAIWAQMAGCGDPRQTEEWIWKRFTKEAPKYVRVFNGSQAKLPMQPEYLRQIVLNTHFDLNNSDDVRELLAYAILIFTGIRVGHLLPKDSSKKAKRHLIDWNNVKFEPDFALSHLAKGFQNETPTPSLHQNPVLGITPFLHTVRPVIGKLSVPRAGDAEAESPSDRAGDLCCCQC